MKTEQLDAYPEHILDKIFYRHIDKETMIVSIDDGSLVLGRYENKRQGASLHFGTERQEVNMTLAHAGCYEPNRMGTRLTHNPRYERPQRLYLDNLML